MKYWGETSRNIHKRFYEDMGGIGVGNLYNTLLQRIYNSDYKFDFNAATLPLACIKFKWLRQIFEVGAISLYRNVNNRPGFFIFSPYLGRHIENTYKILDL